MTTSAVQALLDPSGNGTGIQIHTVINEPTGTNASHYCIGQVGGVGKEMWVDLVIANTDAQKNTAIRAAFGVA